MHCNVCKSNNVITEKMGEVFFVMCKSDQCARRPDNGQMTAGRPLSNGKPTAAEAEADYAEILRRQAEAAAL